MLSIRQQGSPKNLTLYGMPEPLEACRVCLVLYYGDLGDERASIDMKYSVELYITKRAGNISPRPVPELDQPSLSPTDR